MFLHLTTLTAEVVACPLVSQAGVKCCIMLTDCDIFLFVYLLERIEIWRGGSQVWRSLSISFIILKSRVGPALGLCIYINIIAGINSTSTLRFV